MTCVCSTAGNMSETSITRESLIEQAREIYEKLDDSSKATFISLLEELGSLLSSHWDGVATKLRTQYGKWEEAIPLADAAEELNLFFASLAMRSSPPFKAGKCQRISPIHCSSQVPHLLICAICNRPQSITSSEPKVGRVSRCHETFLRGAPLAKTRLRAGYGLPQNEAWG